MHEKKRIIMIITEKNYIRQIIFWNGKKGDKENKCLICDGK